VNKDVSCVSVFEIQLNFTIYIYVSGAFACPTNDLLTDVLNFLHQCLRSVWKLTVLGWISLSLNPA